MKQDQLCVCVCVFCSAAKTRMCVIQVTSVMIATTMAMRDIRVKSDLLQKPLILYFLVWFREMSGPPFEWVSAGTSASKSVITHQSVAH